MAYGIEMPGASGATPGRAVPRRRRRRGLVAAGLLLAAVGFVALVVGAFATTAFDSWTKVTSTAEGTVPGTVVFDADDAAYEVLLVRRRGSLDGEAASTRCSVRLADGSELVIDGRVQSMSVSGGGTATVGSFDAVAGQTAVRCEGADDGRRFVVDAVDRWELWALLAMWIGVVVFVIGLLISGLGWLWPRYDAGRPVHPSPA